MRETLYRYRYLLLGIILAAIVGQVTFEYSSTTVVNSKALWHHALFDDIGGDDAKNGGPEDG
jgi:hypothetical protein